MRVVKETCVVNGMYGVNMYDGGVYEDGVCVYGVEGRSMDMER